MDFCSGPVIDNHLPMEGIHLQCGRPVFDPWVRKIPWRRESYPLQYSGLENSMDCTVHGVAKSQTRLSDFHFHCQWRQHRLHPFSGKSTRDSGNKAHASQLRSPRAATTEAWELRASAPQQERPQQWESWTLQPCSPQLEKAHQQQRRASRA